MKNRRRFLYLAAAIVAVVATTVGLSRLKPAAPSVELGTLWMDTVRKGPMVREVRGPGTLVPEADPVDFRGHAGTSGSGAGPARGDRRTKTPSCSS